MIVSFNDSREDIHLWEPQSGAYVRIDTGMPNAPERQVTRGSQTLVWPELRGASVRNPNVPVGQPGAFVTREPTREQADAWLKECCELAATHFGAAAATQYNVEYRRS